MLIASNLGHYHQSGQWLFRGVSFSLKRGQWLGLNGRSGVGKSTLAGLLSGFAEPKEGTVMLNDRALPNRGIQPVQRLFQHADAAINPRRTVRQIIDEGAVASAELLSLFEIDHHWLSRYPRQLSGGQLARIMLVRALAVQPEYLIADELTASLDAVSQAHVWLKLKDYAQKHQMGVMVISHNHCLLEALCENVIFLN